MINATTPCVLCDADLTGLPHVRNEKGRVICATCTSEIVERLTETRIPKGRPHSHETVAAMREMWDRGNTATKIGRAFGVSRSTITGVAARHGFPKRMDAPIVVRRAEWVARQAILGETDTLLTESPKDAAMARYKAALVTAAQDHTAVYNVWDPTYQAACDAAEATYKTEMADIARNKTHDA